MISSVPAVVLLFALLGQSVRAQTGTAIPCPQLNYCLNGATCYAYQQGANTAQFCLCPPGFSGFRCENVATIGPIPTTPSTLAPTLPPSISCAANPCQNGGVCSEASGRAACYCKSPAFYGAKCEFANPCKVDSCLNGGICYISAANQALCSCNKDCTGAKCESCNNCFTTNSTVTLESGRNIHIQDVSIGDRLLSIDSEGKLAFSQVLMWLDRAPNVKMSLVQLTTESGKTFKATNHHVVAVRDSFIQMKDVKVGDEIRLVNREQKLGHEKVVLIDTIQEAIGAYSPLTEEGTIVVDGVGASCYAYSHKLGQIAFAPMKVLTKLGLASGHADNGLHWYSGMFVDMINGLNLRTWMSS